MSIPEDHIEFLQHFVHGFGCHCQPWLPQNREQGTCNASERKPAFRWEIYSIYKTNLSLDDSVGIN